jgi:histidyl-tRNA synthetase
VGAAMTTASMGRAAGAVRLVRGMRDQMPPEQRALDRVIAAAVAASERAMYSHVDAPVVEHASLFE